MMYHLSLLGVGDEERGQSSENAQGTFEVRM